jgi:hypothetical protein
MIFSFTSGRLLSPGSYKYKKPLCFAVFTYTKTANPFGSAVIWGMFLRFLYSFAHESFRFYEPESVDLALSAELRIVQRESPATLDF